MRLASDYKHLHRCPECAAVSECFDHDCIGAGSVPPPEGYLVTCDKCASPAAKVCSICGKPYDELFYHYPSPHDGSHFVCVFPPAPEQAFQSAKDKLAEDGFVAKCLHPGCDLPRYSHEHKPHGAPEQKPLQRFALSDMCDNAAHSSCPYPERCTCPCHIPAAPAPAAQKCPHGIYRELVTCAICERADAPAAQAETDTYPVMQGDLLTETEVPRSAAQPASEPKCSRGAVIGATFDPQGELIAVLVSAIEVAINTVECDSLDKDGAELPWYAGAKKALALAYAVTPILASRPAEEQARLAQEVRLRLENAGWLISPVHHSSVLDDADRAAVAAIILEALGGAAAPDVDLIADRQFIAGAEFGWNCGVAATEEPWTTDGQRSPTTITRQQTAQDKFKQALENRRKEIHEALSAPVAAREGDFRAGVAVCVEKVKAMVVVHDTWCIDPSKCVCGAGLALQNTITALESLVESADSPCLTCAEGDHHRCIRSHCGCQVCQAVEADGLKWASLTDSPPVAAQPNGGEREFGRIVVELLQEHFDEAREIAMRLNVQFDTEGPFVPTRTTPVAAQQEVNSSEGKDGTAS